MEVPTSQIALKVELNLLPILGNAVKATLNFSAGSGFGRLTDINCTATPGISILAHTTGAAIAGDITAGGLLSIVGSVNLTGAVNGAPDSTVSYAYPSEFTMPPGGNPAFSRTVGVANVGLDPTTLVASGGTGLLGATLTLLAPTVDTALGTLNGLLQPTLSPLLATLGLDIAGATISALQIQPPPPTCGTTRLVK